jgi:hypothetical protein
MISFVWKYNSLKKYLHTLIDYSMNFKIRYAAVYTYEYM